jgi:hypothetical protein
MAIAYDLVLEDHVLARQGVKRQQRPFGRELAEMVRYAVGYQSRAFVVFGQPITLEGLEPNSRRDALALAHHLIDRIGALYKVLPTAVLAAAMRPSIARQALEGRIDALLDTLRTAGAHMDIRTGRDVLEEATEPLVTRGVIVVERGLYRVRERNVLRYYARSIQHLLVPSRRTGRTH